MSNLGSRESDFLSTLAGKGKNIFMVSESVEFWGSAHNARIAVHRLLRKGWLKRIEKGKYLIVPFEAGKDRHWTEDPLIIAGELVRPASIGYWSAIRHWNWTEQIPMIVYVQTTARKNNPRPKVLGVQYEIVTLNPRKYFGHVKEWRNGKAVFVSGREKTLIDCADDVGRAGGIDELSKAVKAAALHISWKKLDEYAGRFPNRAVMKRLGYLLETLVPGLSQEGRNVLLKWQRELSAGIVPLQPSARKSGRTVTRWRIRVNAEIG